MSVVLLFCWQLSYFAPCSTDTDLHICISRQASEAKHSSQVAPFLGFDHVWAHVATQCRDVASLASRKAVAKRWLEGAAQSLNLGMLGACLCGIA